MPDDTAVIRIARSEMGQGTLTGLAQLVADELEADWAKVRAEYISPEANLASKRAWGDMSTGGSRGLRTSVDYVRKGGAAARTMLVQAAATRWGVPVSECSAAHEQGDARAVRPQPGLRRAGRRRRQAARSRAGRAEETRRNGN